MAIYQWPDHLRPTSMTVALVSNTQSFRSKFSGALQTTRMPGSRWKISMTFERSLDSEAREIEALLFKLDGMAHRLELRDFGREPIQPNGAPKVSLGGQSGDTLQTSGWTPGELTLSVGQWFTVGGELKMSTATTYADSSGNAVISFAPPIRNSPAINAVVDTMNTFATFVNTSNEASVDRAPADRNSYTLTFEEDITL